MFIKNKMIKLPTILVSLLVSSIAFAESVEQTTESQDYDDTLTGDWGGLRNDLQNAGISTEFIYKLDFMRNQSGGIKRGTRVLDNLEAIFTLDGEKILGTKGLSATVHLLSNSGGHPDTELVGTAQGVNNIEVQQSTGKLYQLFVEQNLLDDKFSVLAGLYDLNSEFYVTDSSGLFLHSTFGIGTDISQSGENGPSIFPFTSVGTRVRVNPTSETYIQATILDGVSGDVNHQRGTHIRLARNDGWLVVGETGYTPQDSKIAVGAWYYTEKFDHLTAAGVKKHSKGAYIIGEQKLYAETTDQGLTGFARFGFANGEVNQFNYAWSTGLVYTGLFPNRDEGQLGLALASANNSSQFKKSVGTPVDAAETIFELTYSDTIMPWLSVQPNLQYVVNPSTDKTLDNALVLGTRFSLNF